MIRVNLIPAEEAQRAAGQRQELAVALLVSMAAVGVLAGLHGLQFWESAATDRELAAVERELTAIQGPFIEISKMEKQRNELREKLRVIDQLQTKSSGPVRVLEDLSAATPDKLWLTEFTEAAGAMRVAGLGIDEQTVAEFLRHLGTSPYFLNVDLQETSQVDQAGVKQKKFVITGQVNYLGAKGPAPDATPAGAGVAGAKPGMGAGS